jgi:hypothetical protein
MIMYQMYRFIALIIILHLLLHDIVAEFNYKFKLEAESEEAERIAYLKLISALERFANGSLTEVADNLSNGKDHFEDLHISLYWSPADIIPSDGQGQDNKFIIGVNTMKKMKKDFIVYAAGNASKHLNEDKH